MLNTYTHRGLEGYDTHGYGNIRCILYDIIIWKIGGSFALIDTEN